MDSHSRYFDLELSADIMSVMTWENTLADITKKEWEDAKLNQQLAVEGCVKVSFFTLICTSEVHYLGINT